MPSGDLAALFERALDALLEKETRKRFGTGRPRRERAPKEGSRHVPVEVKRAVWDRDGSQCTFVDAEGRRCCERSHLTLEHREPFALGGPSNLENLCLLCSAHNLASAREFFGTRQIEAAIHAKTAIDENSPAKRAGMDDDSGRESVRAGMSETLEEQKAIQSERLVVPDGAYNERKPIEVVPATRVRDASSSALLALCQMGFRRQEAAAAVGRVCSTESGLGIQQLLRKSLLLLVPAVS